MKVHQHGVRSAKRSQRGFCVVVLVGALVPIWLAVESVSHLPAAAPAAPADVVLPNPNGYDDFLKAGEMRSADPASADAFEPNIDRAFLQEVITRHVETLKLLRVGLSRECRVPTKFSQTYVEVHMPDLAKLKGLALLLKAEGRLAELNNRPADAAQSYVDVIRFGNEGSRGGLMIDKLVGVSWEAIGVKSLTELRDKLTGAQCLVVIRSLESIEAKAETAEKVLENEKVWAGKSFGLRGVVAAVVQPGLTEPALVKFKEKMAKIESDRRRLTIAFAVRTYEQEKGALPKGFSDLAPAYLKAIPVDPATGKPMDFWW